ncbi:hypothetical protein D3C71_1687840 [compost metagenome]
MVFHQGDERRDNERHARQQHRRNLIADRLPAAGRHDAKCIPPFQKTRDNPLLAFPEIRVAVIFMQHLLRLFHRKFLRIHRSLTPYKLSISSLPDFAAEGQPP